MDYRHFKMCLWDFEPVPVMVYDATAAPTRAPFGRSTAISVRMHASEIRAVLPDKHVTANGDSQPARAHSAQFTMILNGTCATCHSRAD